MVYHVQWAEAKKKHANKLVNAQKTLNLEETVELMLELGPEACTNTITIAGISAMRRPTNHEPVEPAETRRAILDEMLKPHDANQEQPPNSINPDVKAAVLALKAAAAPRPGAANKRTRKRRSAYNNGSEVDEPENPRKRITTDSDVSSRLSDAYIARLLEDGPSQLNQTLLNDLLEDTTAANFSQVVPPAQNESSNDTIVELTASLAGNIDEVARDRIRGQIQAILKEEDDQDERLREQLEMLSRFTVRGPAEVDGPLGIMMKPFLDSMVNFAADVLGVARNGDVLAYLEKRRRLREEHGYQAPGAKGAEGGQGSERAEDENEYHD